MKLDAVYIGSMTLEKKPLYICTETRFYFDFVCFYSHANCMQKTKVYRFNFIFAGNWHLSNHGQIKNKDNLTRGKIFNESDLEGFKEIFNIKIFVTYLDEILVFPYLWFL